MFIDGTDTTTYSRIGIQAAIDYAYSQGGGMYGLLLASIYILDSTILIKSGVHLGTLGMFGLTDTFVVAQKGMMNIVVASGFTGNAITIDQGASGAIFPRLLSQSCKSSQRRWYTDTTPQWYCSRYFVRINNRKLNYSLC